MPRSKSVSFFMWLFPLAFFAYQFIFRLWPSLMMQPIMEQFKVDATQFGVMASFYYYGYAGMQIPLAIFLDKYGARTVLSICAVICGLAMWTFTYTENWNVVLLSRFLIGAGSAVGFLAVSKVISEWFSKAAYSKMIGFSFSVGLLGAIYGGNPISLWIEQLGAPQVASVLGGVSILLGILTYVFLRKAPVHDEHSGTKHDDFKLSHLGLLLKSPLLWGLAIANFLMVGALEGFSDVWGVNYLMTAYDFEKSTAAGFVSFVFVGMLFGGPVLSACSQRWGAYPVMAACGVGIAILFILILLTGVAWPAAILSLIFFLIGILCCYQVIVFVAGSQLVSHALLGVTIGFINCMNMLGGSFFHTIIGFMMDFFWNGQTENAIRIYPLSSYQWALGVIPVAAMLGAGLIVMIHRHLKQNSVKIG